MGWNEWQAAIDDAVKARTAELETSGEKTPKPKRPKRPKKPKPKKKELSKMSGWDYMMKVNREGRGFI